MAILHSNYFCPWKKNTLSNDVEGEDNNNQIGSYVKC